MHGCLQRGLSPTPSRQYPQPEETVTGSGGTVSYISGQTSYTSIVSSSGTVHEGIQQPFEIQVVTQLNGPRQVNYPGM